MTVLRGAAASDVGRVRQVNEDRYLVGDGLFAVADGVGGHQAGEVAAQTSVEALASSFTEKTTDGLVSAIQEANRAVWRLAQGQADRRGMGTTLTVLAVIEEDGEEQLAIANVGDSRAYLFQRGELVQVSEDHSLVEELVREGQLSPEEAQVHPQRSIITRALGMESDIEVDSWILTPYAGDRILLCSDGLTNEVSPDKIASTLRQLSDPQEVARDLVRQARTSGGNDNITVVVVDVVDDGGRAEAASAALGKSESKSKSKRKPAVADPEPASGTASTPRVPPDNGTDGDTTALRRTSGVSSRARAGTAGGRENLTAIGDGPDTTPGRATAPNAGTATRRPPVADAPDRARAVRPRRFTWRVAIFMIAFLIVLLVSMASVAWYARSAYFVGLEGDQVAIFRGRPGGILWFNPTVVEREQLTVADVLPAKVDDLRAGKPEATKADADRYVNNLRQEAAERRRAQAPTTPVSPTSPAPAPGSPASTTAPPTTRL